MTTGRVEQQRSSDREDIERLDLQSMPADRRDALVDLFPEVRTERNKIDFDRLKLALGESVDVGRERFGLNWPGKANCFRVIQQPSVATLRPAPEESVAFDTTKNLIVEGDNLEVLKLLQKSYLGKVKMIYIDPPYNTGNDFIYPDDFSETIQTYLQYTGQVDAEGKKFGTNSDTQGRFHSRWLNMMYPRLYLARNLLREDGYFLASIEDAELSNLTKLLDEIFGEENRLALLVYDKNRKNDATFFSVGHEYILVYARDKALLRERGTVLRAPKEGVEEVRTRFEELKCAHDDNWALVRAGLKALYDSWPRGDPRKPLARFTKVDEKGPYREDGDLSWPGGGGPRYDVLHPVTSRPCKVPTRGWIFPKQETMLEKIKANEIVFGPDETTVPGLRRNLFEKSEEVMRSVHYSYAQTATQYLKGLFSGEQVFDNPKGEPDIRALIEYLTEPGDLILDIFAGSGTTGEAALRAGGGRQFILVQLPEPTGRADYPSIAAIAMERLRRVVQAMETIEVPRDLLFSDEEARTDLGFRVFKLAESNFMPWQVNAAADENQLSEQLTLHVDHIRPGRTDLDLLYEILLKSGFPLTATVEERVVVGKKVYAVAEGTFLICLDRDLTLEVIRAMADASPSRIVCLDEGFAGNDQLKANAVQIFRTKGIESFKTV